MNAVAKAVMSPDRYTFHSSINPHTGKDFCTFTKGDQYVNEVRYLLKTCKDNHQVVCKIGAHKGQIKVHFRDYQNFTSSSAGFATKKGYHMLYDKFTALCRNINHI